MLPLRIRTIIAIPYKLSTKHFATQTARHDKPANRIQAWQIHSYGDLSELQLSVCRSPIIARPTDVLVKVQAASVNPIDRVMIAGYGRTLFRVLRQCNEEFPMTLGRDFSGTVIGKGHAVGGSIKIGDSVYGIISPHQQGSHGESVLTDASLVRHKPEHLTHVEAASFLYAAMTAWSALYLSGDLVIRSARGQRVLVLGASGGVGTLAVQMLKSQGITVVGTCSKDAITMVESLGTDTVIDYKSSDYNERVAQEGKYDIILDCAKHGYENIPSQWRFSRYITLNSPLMNDTDQFGLVQGLMRSATALVAPNIRGVLADGRTCRWAYFVPSSDGLRFVDDLIRQKKITPIIHKVFKFDQVPKAFEELDKGHLRGKIVIDMS